MLFAGILYYLQIFSLDTIPFAIGAVHAYEMVNIVRRTNKTNVLLDEKVVVVIVMNLSILFLILVHAVLMANIFDIYAISPIIYIVSFGVQLTTAYIEYYGGPKGLQYYV